MAEKRLDLRRRHARWMRETRGGRGVLCVSNGELLEAPFQPVTTPPSLYPLEAGSKMSFESLRDEDGPGAESKMERTDLVTWHEAIDVGRRPGSVEQLAVRDARHRSQLVAWPLPQRNQSRILARRVTSDRASRAQARTTWMRLMADRKERRRAQSSSS